MSLKDFATSPGEYWVFDSMQDSQIMLGESKTLLLSLFRG